MTDSAQTLRPLNIAILGAGRIAQKMATTLTMMRNSDDYANLANLYAIASRSQEKSNAFAAQYKIAHAYGSYESMLEDPNIDLVYIATPHSLHAEQAIACMRAGKHVLVEKSFTANLSQARAVIDASDDTGMFCAEAMWTRYMPSRAIIDRVIASGKLGSITTLTANLCYPLTHKERMISPDLAGGALLDIGVYPLTFIDMAMGEQQLNQLASSMQPFSTGVDAQSTTTLYYENGTMATAITSMLAASDRAGVICGTEGYAVCNNINNPESLDIFNAQHKPTHHIDMPAQLTGFEYEVAAAVNAIRAGKTECIEITHADTLRMMALYDQIRHQWNLTFPFEQ